MAKKPAPSQFAGLKGLSDKARAKLMDGPDAPNDAPAPAMPPAPIVAATEDVPQRKRGRPPGNRSSVNYEQTTVIMNSLHKQIARMYALDKKTDLSTVINTALAEFLERNFEDSYDSMVLTIRRKNKMLIEKHEAKMRRQKDE